MTADITAAPPEVVDAPVADEADEATKIRELVDFVLDLAEIPMSWWAVAALLESRGLRDVDAIERYGKRSIFDLAQTVFDASMTALAEQEKEEALPPPPSKLQLVKDFIRFYAKGTVFALPMAGQIAAILVLRYSLWAWLDFSVMQASLVAIGTIGSFVVSGGLVQALGREGTFYKGQQNPILLERICIVLGRLGLIATGVVAVGAFVLNTLLPYFSAWEFAIAAMYFLLLTPLWLMLAVLYMLSDNVAILLSTLIGTGAVHIVMLLGGGIHLGHAVGLVVATAAAVGWGWFRIKRMKKAAEKKHHLAKIPRPAVLSYIIEPFLIYGTLYFSLLFVDRVIGWSASEYRLPVVIWFRTAYELGMDWALLSLVFTFAVLEYTVNQFNRIIIPVQQSIEARKYEEHNRQFMRFYIRQNILLAVVGIASIFVTYFAVMQLARFDHVQEIRDFFASPITYFTYWSAAVGYLLLAFALLNGLFFFSLAKPRIVVRCIAWALVTDVVVGFVLSRAVSYEYAVFGLVAGCGVFAVLMFRRALTMFRNLDYYYYSAF